MSAHKRGLAAVTLGLAVVATACGGGASPSAAPASAAPTAGGSSAAFNWKQFEGQTIRVVLNQHPWQEAIEPMISEFEEMTGIKVEVEKLPEEQFRQRVQVELTASSPDLDVYMTSLLNEGAKFARNGWYSDLKPLIADPALTSPDYAFDDFGEVLIDSHTYDGSLVAIPIQLETQMLYYRKDILAAAGVQVPTTMDELEQVAKAIDDPNGTRAFVARGKGRAAVTQFSTYLYNFGGQWTKEGSYDAGFNTPEGLAAFDYYTRMLRLYGPRGTTNMSWEEALPLFASGQVAMYTDASTFLPTILKDGSADVVNNLGFAPMPAGPGGSFQSFFGWGLAMSAFTEKPGPSWLFLQWATSPEVVEQITVNDKVVGGRSSVDFGDSFPADWAAAFKSSIPNARPQLPAVIPVSEVRDVIGVAVIVGIEGGDLQAALATAETQFNATVAASGN